MKLTNKYNLPAPMVAALEADEYDNGGSDITATSLWKPPYMVDLQKKHPGIEVDASDLLGSLLGVGFHAVMSRYDNQAISEKRLFAHIEGVNLSGQFDRLILEEGILQDYKVTSVARFKHQLVESEWENQLNTYAMLLRRHGVEVKALQIVAFLRDWHKASSQRSLDYPPLPVQVVTINLWDAEEAEARIAERVNLHKNPTPCTPEDQWYKAPKVAVMKDGRKTAVKLFDNQGEAEAFIANAKDSKQLYIETRKGSYLRCEEYCSVSSVCPHWQSLKGEE